jgi:N-methylhydantoinase A
LTCQTERKNALSLRIGVDIGGTFTDFTVVDDEGTITLWKEESDVDEPARAIETGLVAIANQAGVDLERLLGDTSVFVHGSTIATNTVIQRNGPLVGLLCTKGFRDLLYFRDGFKPERFNIHLPPPQPFVDRYLRLGVEERVDKAGSVLTELSESDVRAAAARFRAVGVKAVAVAFLWSIVNSSHERRAAEILQEELEDVYVLCSCDVLPEIREWERTSATVLSGYILPRVDDYLRELKALLTGSGYDREPLIMQNNGGCSSVEEILNRPVNMLASGPAAAPAAATYHTQGLEQQDLIIADMGGTSFDICLVRNGRPTVSREVRVESQPIGVPGVEVHSIGAGGGSIAWVDAGGALRVGPRSAGARPGPACYGRGGAEPTVTDANLMLGYLDPENFLGGRRSLRADLAAEAIGRSIGDPLGLDVQAASAGIVRVVDANMLRGIQAISVERGLDPRNYMLVAGGGAGGLHATRLARLLRMRQVLIPREASTFCAFGMTVTDVRHDYVQSHHTLSSEVDLPELSELFGALEREARDRLRTEGFDDDHIVFERMVDARYPYQVHELMVPVPRVESYAADDVETIAQSFHAEHHAQFTYSRDDLPVEFLHWRVTAVGRGATDARHLGEPEATTESAAEGALVGERDAYFEDAGGLTTTPVYSLDRLSRGTRLEGPAIVESATTTIVVNRGDTLTAGQRGNLLVVLAFDAGVGSDARVEAVVDGSAR